MTLEVMHQHEKLAPESGIEFRPMAPISGVCVRGLKDNQISHRLTQHEICFTYYFTACVCNKHYQHLVAYWQPKQRTPMTLEIFSISRNWVQLPLISSKVMFNTECTLNAQIKYVRRSVMINSTTLIQCICIRN